MVTTEDRVPPALSVEDDLAKLLPCQEELARNVARVMGPDSAAGRGLAQLAAARQQGQPAIIYPLRGAWLVGTRVEIAAALVSAGAKSPRLYRRHPA